MSTPSTDARVRAREERRERILDAAWPLFSEHGFERVTMAQIAAAAGVSTRTVFNHFPRKDDIVFRHDELVLTMFERSLRERRPGQRISEAVMENALDMIDLDPGYPGEFAQAVHMIAMSPTLQQRRLSMFEAHTRITRDALLEQDPSLERGGLADGLARAMTGFHWSAMEARGAAMARGESPEAVRETAIETIRRGYAILEAGFAAAGL
ncbi:MAG: TetR family transcriptional regulator [Candidatus Leucobacter sulfamidivorax]|nr:TetR family transcriptional regulator [Candidatus Leucobacter sulfamidivorax]